MPPREEDIFLWQGYIDLIVLLGSCSLEQKYSAHQAVWTWPYLQGPYTDFDRTLELAEGVLSSTMLRESLFGYAHVPSGKQVGFVTNLSVCRMKSPLNAAERAKQT